MSFPVQNLKNLVYGYCQNTLQLWDRIVPSLAVCIRYRLSMYWYPNKRFFFFSGRYTRSVWRQKWCSSKKNGAAQKKNKSISQTTYRTYYTHVYSTITYIPDTTMQKYPSRLSTHTYPSWSPTTASCSLAAVRRDACVRVSWLYW